LIFREYRYFLYPKAKISENLLELNEGLAEYTGVMVSGMTREEAVYYFERDINEFVRFTTFVRSFAYETTPVYGYLLQQTDKYWNKKITPSTNLTDFFINDFGISLPIDLASAEHGIEDQYDGKLIRMEETNREAVRGEQVERYQKELVDQPHLDIRFENMKFAFDPRNPTPLGDNGTVYPEIRIVDNWGILDVHNGALIGPYHDRVIVSAPTKIDGKNVSGDGWTLQLNDGYTMVEDYNTGNYRITRR